ncbi:helix-turn-helix domain-containing protein [Pseudoalteromonas sp. R3]|uniref:helix-turn-helix domain-containing protein n=1 Tax=Pseudoalteromonas sp. R3 TaxID=1709477 RepID=UPI0006B61E3B|nr:helix-turn-helix domain-containing protein [Pseudoalteromonas sp. R3]AZZ98268.1 hypothetical protein ELR70_14770 [Pseudoalteromonas sp. R3]
MFTDSMAVSEIGDVISKLQKKFGVSSDRALSEELGLSHSGIAMARKKETLPYAAIVLACIKKGVSLDEIFEIESKSKSNDATFNDKKPTVESSGSVRNSTEDALAALALVEEIMDDLLEPKHLDAERELIIRNKLRPMLIEKAFEHNFNEIMVKTIAEGALYMAY